MTDHDSQPADTCETGNVRTCTTTCPEHGTHDTAGPACQNDAGCMHSAAVCENGCLWAAADELVRLGQETERESKYVQVPRWEYDLMDSRCKQAADLEAENARLRAENDRLVRLGEANIRLAASTTRQTDEPAKPRRRKLATPPEETP